MKTCQRCSSKRVFSVTAKCSDCCCVDGPGRQTTDGYVPDDIGIGGGDYVEMQWCLDCGQIQGTWPLPGTELDGAEPPGLDPATLESGTWVDYHARVGGPVTRRARTVGEPWQLGNGGWVVKIEGGSGGVSLDALSAPS